eukprot:1097037-Rhodomonas_salina.2
MKRAAQVAMKASWWHVTCQPPHSAQRVPQKRSLVFDLRVQAGGVRGGVRKGEAGFARRSCLLYTSPSPRDRG